MTGPLPWWRRPAAAFVVDVLLVALKFATIPSEVRNHP